MLSPSILPSEMAISPRGVVTAPVSFAPSTLRSMVRVCVPRGDSTVAVHLPLRSAARTATEPNARKSTASSALRNMDFLREKILAEDRNPPPVMRTRSVGDKSQLAAERQRPGYFSLGTRGGASTGLSEGPRKAFQRT